MKTEIRNLCFMVAVFGLLLSGTQAVAQDKEEAKPKSKVSIAGTWTVTAGSRSGNDIDGERLPPEVIVSDESFTIPTPDGSSFVMAYKIVSKESPYHVDLEITEGPADGVALGIVKVDGNEMTLCYDPTGVNRPEEFETTDENGFFMFVMEKDTEPFDAKKMVGDWQCVEGTRSGEEVAEDRMASTINFTKDMITIPIGPDMAFKMSYKVNSDESPATIDMEIKEGPGEGGAAKGIVKMEDGKFYLCYHPTGGDRPKDFESTSENECFLFVMEAVVD